MAFKAAKCPSCAGDLQVPDDRDSVKCMYCGNDIIVREAIKAAVGGVNIENLLKLARVMKGDEAKKYYEKVIEHDPENVEAWIGRGLSSRRHCRCFDEEFNSNFYSILQFTPEDRRSELRKHIICVLIEALRSWWSVGKAGKTIYECLLDPPGPPGTCVVQLLVDDFQVFGCIYELDNSNEFGLLALGAKKIYELTYLFDGEERNLSQSKPTHKEQMMQTLECFSSAIAKTDHKQILAKIIVTILKTRFYMYKEFSCDRQAIELAQRISPGSDIRGKTGLWKSVFG